MTAISGNYIADAQGTYNDEDLRRAVSDRGRDMLTRAWADKSGLGTVAGVLTAAAIAYMAVKARQNRMIGRALRSGLPVKREWINPLIAFGAGGGTALAGKHFYDRYNNSDEFIY